MCVCVCVCVDKPLLGELQNLTFIDSLRLLGALSRIALSNNW